MKINGPTLSVAVAVLFFPQMAQCAKELSDQQLTAIRFDQNLNAQVSLDLPFQDENGRPVKLGDYIRKKPVILVLGYYECPMLCTLVMNGMVESLQDIKWTIGNEFEVISISINPQEGPALAAAKKARYLKSYGKKGAEPGWHFLTGNSNSIARVANEVGFHFLRDPKSGQYAHPSGLIFLTPEGKVAGYRFGVVFQPAQVLASLQQARSGTAGSPIQNLVLLCFHYNPISGKYGATIMWIIRLLAVLTILGLVWMVVKMTRGSSAKPAPPNQTQPPLEKLPP